MGSIQFRETQDFSPMQLMYSPFAIPIVAIVCVFAVKIVSLLTDAARGIVKHRNEVDLKQTMIARGMTADEIERVLYATTAHREDQPS